MFRKLTWLIFVALLASCATSQHAHPLRLPGTINPIGGHPLIRAYVDDKPLQLAPDTGAAQHLILFSHTATSLGIDVTGEDFVDDVPIKLRYTQADEPGFETAFVLDAPVGEFDGLIGWPEIRRGIWQIDLAKRRHAFHLELPEKVRTWKYLEILDDDHILRVRSPDGRVAVVDTGASRAIHLDKKHFDAWLELNPKQAVTLYSGYSPAARDGFFAKRCTRSSVFEFGPLEFKKLMVYESFAEQATPTQRYEIDLLFGLEAFSNRELWIDGPGRRLYVSPPRPSSWKLGKVSLVRAVFVPDSLGERLRARVLEGGAAYRAGLRDGDELIAINGRRKIRSYDLKAILSLPGRRANVLVRRQGRVLRFSWVVPSRF